MTLFFPDLSNNNGLLDITGAPALIAKASEGAGFVDVDYPGYKRAAQAAGIPFMAYHYLHNGDTGGIPTQAQNAFAVVGADVPLMVDVEVVEGEPNPTLDDLTGFVDAYRLLGGRVVAVYLPRWFWAGHWGSPNLVPAIEDRGLFLISSNYTTYSDYGPGWEPYGGVTPLVWQYTNAGQLNGASVDYNAFLGTAEEFSALLDGSTPMALNPDDILALTDGSAADGSGYLNPANFPDGPQRWAAEHALQHNIAAVQAQLSTLQAAVDAIQAHLNIAAPTSGLVPHTHTVLDHTLTETASTTGPAVAS